MKVKYTGLHIIADLYGCDFDNLKKTNLADLEKKVSTLINKVNLHEQGRFYKKFGRAAFSGIISLTESHMTFHTWPELKYISLDIFVCNYERDNSDKAKKLYQEMLDFFKPKDKKEYFLKR